MWKSFWFSPKTSHKLHRYLQNWIFCTLGDLRRLSSRKSFWQTTNSSRVFSTFLLPKKFSIFNVSGWRATVIWISLSSAWSTLKRLKFFTSFINSVSIAQMPLSSMRSILVSWLNDLLTTRTLNLIFIIHCIIRRRRCTFTKSHDDEISWQINYALKERKKP